MKFILVLLTFFIFKYSHAVDTFDFNTNRLTIPNVQVGNIAYSNVVITPLSIVSIGSAPANGTFDSFNSLNGQLFIPSVIAGGMTHYNVVTTIKNIISVGESKQLSDLPLSFKKVYTPLTTTISTSEGALLGITDFWLKDDWLTSAYGYGPSTIQQVNICITAEVSYKDCGKYSNNGMPLSDQILNNIDKGLSRFTNSGKKIFLRFLYNFGSFSPVANDAPIETILMHLDQLAPIVIKYKDIIYAFQAGFIGEFGEWQTSTNNNLTKTNRNLLLAKEQKYFSGLFPIQVRYVQNLVDYLGGTVISPDFGIHDDGFLWGDSDAHTFNNLSLSNGIVTFGAKEVLDQNLLNYASLLSSKTVFHGEPCCDLIPTKWTCDNLDQYARKLNLQTFPLNIYPYSIADFLKSQGCLYSFLNKVGTRIEVKDVGLNGSSNIGSTLNLSITLSNTGYGHIPRPRPVNLVFLDGKNIITSIPISLTQLDLRQLTNSSPTQTFKFNVTLPVDLNIPNYYKNLRLALSIPDPAPTLTFQAGYMLPLNSVDGLNQVYDKSTGLNILGTFN